MLKKEYSKSQVSNGVLAEVDLPNFPSESALGVTAKTPYHLLIYTSRAELKAIDWLYRDPSLNTPVTDATDPENSRRFD